MFNDLPRLWFFAVSQKVSWPPLRSGFRTWRTVIERGAHDLQFRMLIVQRGLYIAVPHRPHYGRKVAGSHQNSRAVVMSRTVKNQFFRKARFAARFSKRDCKLTSGALMRSALTEIPSPPVLHRTFRPKSRQRKNALSRWRPGRAPLSSNCYVDHFRANDSENFLDADLKQDASAKAFLEKTPAENGVPKHFIGIKFMPAPKPSDSNSR